jgi:hypothetical protein
MDEQPSRRVPRPPKTAGDDTVELGISKVERRRLGMDAWEPSLLRKLLAAQNRVRKQPKP